MKLQWTWAEIPEGSRYFFLVASVMCLVHNLIHSVTQGQTKPAFYWLNAEASWMLSPQFSWNKNQWCYLYFNPFFHKRHWAHSLCDPLFSGKKNCSQQCIVGIERLAEVLIEQEKICRVSLCEDSIFYPRQMRRQRLASPGDELERD